MLAFFNFLIGGLLRLLMDINTHAALYTSITPLGCSFEKQAFDVSYGWNMTASNGFRLFKLGILTKKSLL
jgi:hypothetical protein